jgi:membrane dipeptidase
MPTIFDGHCDVLYKMWKQNDYTLFLKNTADLHANLTRLRQGGVKVQTMAIFVPPEVPNELKAQSALEMIDMFYEHILAEREDVRVMKNASDLRQSRVDDALYVILSIEGAAPLAGKLTYLRTFYRLGVRSIGFTWNDRNEAADGVGEPNPSGLSAFGKELLREMNRLGVAVDISHLAEPGFWDCIEYAQQPIMASHCNARALCDHRRNLHDDQIRAIFRRKGLIGINFVPYFLNESGQARIDDVLKHVEYMLSLGGEDMIGFGSDFDGITDTVQQLEHAGQWVELVDACQKRYTETVVEKICYRNWWNYYFRLWSCATHARS